MACKRQNTIKINRRKQKEKRVGEEYACLILTKEI